MIELGKLGESMVAPITKRGFKVIGVDVNQRSVNLVNAGHAPVQETDLEETITSNKERIHATLSHQEAIINSDLSFVIVPTPSDARGAFSLQYTVWAFVSSLFLRGELIARLNAKIADVLPYWAVSTWYFMARNNLTH